VQETKFVVIYRWRVLEERDAEFRTAWLHLTTAMRAYRGSHGSRLMRDASGIYVAIASWPSREAWAATEPPIPHEDAYLATFRAALVESYPIETFTVQIDG
jgi:quinol monooxygenase YgiN